MRGILCIRVLYQEKINSKLVWFSPVLHTTTLSLNATTTYGTIIGYLHIHHQKIAPRAYRILILKKSQ